MNGKTATLLARSASAMAIVMVAKAEVEKETKLSPSVRADLTSRTAKDTYRRLKARWNGTPRPRRGELRRKLTHLVEQTEQGMRLGVVT